MIKKFSYIVFLFGIITIILSFYFPKPKSGNSVIVQFVARNGYGNNLYIDNISIGSRPENDLAITSINNIPKDTIYLNSLYVYNLRPRANVTNFGTKSSTNDTIVMKINSVSYESMDTSGILAPGQTRILTFDSLLMSPGTTYDITIYIKYSGPDTNRYNDTLKQTTVILKGEYRNVMVEEFTSMTSPSCASNNPALDKFIDSNFQYICAVKYHLGFPTPGIDSLYLGDTSFQKQRSDYYYIRAVPTTILDGKLRLPLPYALDTNMANLFYSRYAIGTPVSLDVSDLRLPGDTIQTTINIKLFHTLASNDLRLRIYAIERSKIYEISPGTNGEKNFYDIFRRAYPDSAGYSISNVAGDYQYIYKYHRDSLWVDSLIYTLAFVQDNRTKEVLNCAKSRQTVLYHKDIKNLRTNSISRKADLDLSKKISNTYYKNNFKYKDSTISSIFSLEGFEGPFPPKGWTILNPDVGFTFEQLKGYNGPTLGGVNCVKVPFYDYQNIGEKDTLLSLVFTDVSPLDTFKFDYSYAQYLSTYIDSLVVSMSTDEGETFVTIFSEGGAYMATSAATTLSFAPTSTTQWATYIYPMSEILPFSPGKPVPVTYKLYQNYPNPFNPTTYINFDLPRNVFVTLKIYDILGREIITLLNEKRNAGPQSVPFTPTNLASGIYFYRITAGDFSDVKKMAFIK